MSIDQLIEQRFETLADEGRRIDPSPRLADLHRRADRRRRRAPRLVSVAAAVLALAGVATALVWSQSDDGVRVDTPTLGDSTENVTGSPQVLVVTDANGLQTLDGSVLIPAGEVPGGVRVNNVVPDGRGGLFFVDCEEVGPGQCSPQAKHRAADGTITPLVDSLDPGNLIMATAEIDGRHVALVARSLGSTPETIHYSLALFDIETNEYLHDVSGVFGSDESAAPGAATTVGDRFVTCVVPGAASSLATNGLDPSTDVPYPVQDGRTCTLVATTLGSTARGVTQGSQVYECCNVFAMGADADGASVLVASSERSEDTTTIAVSRIPITEDDTIGTGEVIDRLELDAGQLVRDVEVADGWLAVLTTDGKLIRRNLDTGQTVRQDAPAFSVSIVII